MAETEHHERRQHKRTPFIREVEVVGIGMFRCSDLSISGMYRETVHAFPLGTVVDLRFKLRDTDKHPIMVQAEVLYIHEGVGVGLGFVNLDLEDHEKIVRFLEQG